MIGLPNHGVDPNPEDKTTPRSEKIRSNRFQSFLGCERMKELLCVGKYDEWNSYPPLKIPVQDLFRFWWNRCVVQEYVVGEVLEDIFDYFTEKMRPPQEVEEQVDLHMLRSYSPQELAVVKEFDPRSIMMLPIPNELTIGDFEIGRNTDLSDLDKASVAEIYPHDDSG